MRRTPWPFVGAALALAGAAMLCGCDQQPNPGPSRGAAGEDLPGRLTNAAAATSDYVFAAKDRTTETLQKGLAEMDTKIDELARKSANYTGQAKARADVALAKLREQRDAAARKLDEMKAAGKEK